MSIFYISIFSDKEKDLAIKIKAKGKDSCKVLGNLLLDITQLPRDIIYSFLVMDDESNTIKEIFADDSFVEDGNDLFAVVDEVLIEELADYLLQGNNCLFIYNAITGEALNLMLEKTTDEDIKETSLIDAKGNFPISSSFEDLSFDEIENINLEDFDDEFLDESEEDAFWKETEDEF